MNFLMSKSIEKFLFIKKIHKKWIKNIHIGQKFLNFILFFYKHRRAHNSQNTFTQNEIHSYVHIFAFNSVDYFIHRAIFF